MLIYDVSKVTNFAKLLLQVQAGGQESLKGKVTTLL